MKNLVNLYRNCEEAIETLSQRSAYGNTKGISTKPRPKRELKRLSVKARRNTLKGCAKYGDEEHRRQLFEAE